MLTLAMPQSEPSADKNCSASRKSLVKMDDANPCGTSLCKCSASFKLPEAQNIQQRRERFALHGGGLLFHLDQRGPDVESSLTFGDGQPLAARHCGAGGSRLAQALLHGLKRSPIDQRTHQSVRVARISHDH